MSAQCGAMSVLPNDAWAACAALAAGKLQTSPWQRSEQVEELGLGAGEDSADRSNGWPPGNEWLKDSYFKVSVTAQCNAAAYMQPGSVYGLQGLETCK